jgi:hypothetical protein
MFRSKVAGAAALLVLALPMGCAIFEPRDVTAQNQPARRPVWGAYSAVQLSVAWKRLDGPAITIDPALEHAKARARDESLMRNYRQLAARQNAAPVADKAKPPVMQAQPVAVLGPGEPLKLQMATSLDRMFLAAAMQRDVASRASRKDLRRG